LADRPGRSDEDTAVIFAREDGLQFTITYAQLCEQVARARTGLVTVGIRAGDRVVAVAPNSVETLVMFLAAASPGAVWSSRSPDFGARAIADRFSQIEPTVLLAVDGYRYGGKSYDIRPTISESHDRSPTLRRTELVPDLDPDARLEGTASSAEFTAEKAPLEFEPVPFDHPLWILYSSGTPDLPQGIVHSHGGIVLEQLKVLRLHHDRGPGERFFWFTTTGWMMWNLLVGGLLTGASMSRPGRPRCGSPGRRL
jgi:acetoacetyl-CoA synthetase